MNERADRAVSLFITSIGGAVGMIIFLLVSSSGTVDNEDQKAIFLASSNGFGMGVFGFASILIPSPIAAWRRRVARLEREVEDIGEDCDRKIESLKCAEGFVPNMPALPCIDYKLKDVVGSYRYLSEEVALTRREDEAERALRNARTMLHAVHARLESLRYRHEQIGSLLSVASKIPPAPG
jgi:hypothetical protein